MAKLSLPPTKSTQLRVKRDLAFAEEGFGMLDKKRQILVLELMGTVESAKRAREEVQEKMAVAFTALREAAVHTGAFAMQGEAMAVHAAHSVSVTSRPLMGIYLPTVEGRHAAAAPAFSFAGGAMSDEVMARFTQALEAVDRLAEVENTVFRLAREVRKTQRRVNALEKVFIPDYEETLRFIGDALAEREREEFVIMRMLKGRLEAERDAATHHSPPTPTETEHGG